MALFFVCCLGYFLSKEWLLLFVPFGVLAFLWSILDFRRLYLLMWATIPFAIEVDLPGGLATDFPAEPLMWLSCLMLLFYLYLYHKEISFRFIFHPLFILVLIHFFWIIFTSVVSTEPLISFKYTLAKSWYLVCFVLIPLILFKEVKDYKQWGLFFMIPLVTTVLIILLRHSQYGFTFSTINNAVIPIYRNHVDYACTLGIILPFLWILRKWFVSNLAKIFLYISLALIIAGIYFSYTRAAWLCAPIAFVVFYIIRFRLIRIAIPIVLAAVVLIIVWLSYDNTYLNYAPNYEKTITHHKFDDLVSATYKMEDISTVERFYRWVAGFYMVKEKPLTGFGPSSFYNTYHSYVDRHFTTYVSDNPEKSGMHNYYLMVAVEQGIIGIALFLLLIMAVLIYGERLYHRMERGPNKQLLMATLVSFSCNLFILTLNDMVETDKLGSFFWLCVAIVIMFVTDRALNSSSNVRDVTRDT
ncbi:MAG: O-antigen ligase family protein [Saprospiraceae bacterium]